MVVWKRVRKPLQHFGQFGVVRGHQRKGCQLLRQLLRGRGQRILQLHQERPGRTNLFDQISALPLQQTVQFKCLRLFLAGQKPGNLLPIGLQALRNQSNGTGKLAKLFEGIKPLGRGLALRLCLVYLLHV